MKILFLGGNIAKNLADWLASKDEEVIYKEEKIDAEYIKKLSPDFIVSYNYRHIISKDVIDLVKGKVINLHASYLPWNKGAYSNVWSFLEDTPKGVTIHYIDEGLDTGDIIVQKEVFLDEEKETLKSSYEKLHMEIQELFKENWEKIKNGSITTKKQTGGGSIHFKKDFTAIESLIREKGWDTPIRELKERYRHRKYDPEKLCESDNRGKGNDTEMAEP